MKTKSNLTKITPNKLKRIISLLKFNPTTDSGMIGDYDLYFIFQPSVFKIKLSFDHLQHTELWLTKIGHIAYQSKAKMIVKIEKSFKFCESVIFIRSSLKTEISDIINRMLYDPPDKNNLIITLSFSLDGKIIPKLKKIIQQHKKEIKENVFTQTIY